MSGPCLCPNAYLKGRQAWQSLNLPIYEPHLQDIVCAARDGTSADIHCHKSGSLHAKGPARGKLYFSTDIEEAIGWADLVFVCVNTPTKSTGIGKGAAADVGFVENAARMIAKVAKQDKIVVEKSTVPCKTAEAIRAIVSQGTSER